MEEILNQIIEKNRKLIPMGKVADYIPALSQVNPNYLGLTILDNEGHVYNMGDHDVKFTIQSTSKIISLMLAILDNGENKVLDKVGYIPTEEPFNSLLMLELPHVKRPANPMINAGAIVTTSLIAGQGQEKFHRLLDFMRQISGNPLLSYNEEVYLSEKATGDKNRAIAYLMKSRGMLEGDVEEILDIYFKQCSIEVDTVDLAKIGLFIANRCEGLEIESTMDHGRLASIATSVMTTSGMYDFSGEYAARVGIPSKSGVGGGIMASIPYKMGIGVYSPALDEHANSLAGYGVMKDLSKELNLSIF